MTDLTAIYNAAIGGAATFFVGLLPSLPSLFTLVKVFCILLGLGMLVHSILRLKNLNSSQNQSEMRPILVEILAATALINLNLFIATGSESLFGVGMKEITPVGTAIKTGGDWAAARAQNIVVAILSFIQFVGYIAVAKGITELNNTSKGKANATLSKGLTHIVGGILAVNIMGTLAMLGSVLLPPA
jgi:intracellular multiplication protein IcmC